MSVVGAPKPGMIKPQPTGREKVRATLGRMRPTREVRVDAGFSLAVMLCLLVGLRTVMFGWEWWLAAFVGLVLGFVVGHIQGTYRWPLIGTVALGAVLYLVLGGPLAVRDDVKWGFLPTGQTFKDLVSGPVTGWMDLLTLVPPVDARGNVLAIALFVSLVGTVLVYANARATRSRWRLLVPPFALLAVIIALGTAQPAARWVQGLVLGLLLVGWLAARDHLDPEIGQVRAGGGRPALSRVLAGTALLAVAALAGLLLGPALPGVGSSEDRQVVRTEVVPENDDTVLASPLSSFRDFTRTSPSGWYDRQLLQVEGVPGRTPLRLATLDTWNGSTWGIAGRGSERSDAGRSFQQFGRRVGVLASGSPSEVTVSVPEGGYSGPWVPTTGRVEGIEFAESSQERLEGEAWLNLSTNTVLAPPTLEPGDEYTLRTDLPPLGAQDLPEDLAVARGSMPIRGDDSFVESRIGAWSGDVEDPWESFVAVATTMREKGTYTDGAPAARSDATEQQRRSFTDEVLRYPAGHSEGRLDSFLNSSPLAGNDEQYAATMALVGNRLGIPTRVVIGAIATDDGKVRGRDIRAWVEVKRADGTWFQVLPQMFSPGPDGTKAPESAPQEWEQEPVDIPEPPEPPPPPPEPVVDWSSPSTWPLWAQLLAVFVGLPLLLMLLTPVVIAVRRAIRLRRGGPDRRIGRAWNDLMEEARVLGHRLPASGTRVEQAVALGPVVDAVPAAMRADTLVFGERPPDAAAVTAWQRELRVVRRRMRRAAGPGSRLRALVDPRPLFSRQVDIGLHDSTTAPSRKTRKALR